MRVVLFKRRPNFTPIRVMLPQNIVRKTSRFRFILIVGGYNDETVNVLTSVKCTFSQGMYFKVNCGVCVLDHNRPFPSYLVPLSKRVRAKPFM